MKKYIYTIVAATAMFASCSQDAELNEVIDNQSKAITEIGATTSAETRAVVSSSDQTKVNWETGDQLGVYGEGATGVVAYTLDGTAGTTSGTFKNASSSITGIQAIMYPYQSTATWENANSKLTCEIPTVQTATAGSFDKNAAVMYYIGSETSSTLNYAVAFLKVNIPSGTTDVHAITVYSTHALSGKIGIESDGVSAAEGSKDYVTLQADASNGALADNKDYYIAVLPGTKENLSIAYKYTDHTAKAKQGGSSLTLEKGHVKAISADFENGTVREAKQLWENGPYFATEDVGGNNTMYKWGATEAGDAGTANSGDYDLNHDTAYKIWGSAWRMPTKAEFEGMSDNCNRQRNGSKRFEITSKTGGYGSITLSSNINSSNTNTQGYYWTSTLNPDKPSALYLTCYERTGTPANLSVGGQHERDKEYGVCAVLR